MYRHPSAVPNKGLDIYCVALISCKYESECLQNPNPYPYPYPYPYPNNTEV